MLMRLEGPTFPPTPKAVPNSDPDWKYQPTEAVSKSKDCMLLYLLAGFKKCTQRTVNWDKLRKILQGPDENPTTFLSGFSEALEKFTSLESTSEGILVNSYFISKASKFLHSQFLLHF